MNKHKHLLIVEKITKNRLLLSEIFKNDYPLIETADDFEALELLKSKNDYISAIIIGESLELSRIITLLDEIKRKNLHGSIPVIVLAEDNSSEELLLSHGVLDLISKPFNHNIIKMRVENALKKPAFFDELTDKIKSHEKSQVLRFINDMCVCFVVLKSTSKENISEDSFIIEYCNKRYAELYGVDYLDMIGTHFTEFNNQKHLLDLCVKTAYCENSESVNTLELKKDGRIYTVNIYSPMKYYCTLVLSDITNNKIIQKEYIEALERENQLLTESNKQRELYELLSSQTDSVVFEWNITNNKIYTSGYLSANIVEPEFDWTKPLCEQEIKGIHPDDIKGLFSPFINSIRMGEKQIKTTLRIKKTSGEYIWCRLSANCFHNEKNELVKVITSLKNVNTEIESLNKLKRDAEYDLLTGLYNRNTFYTKARSLINKNLDTNFSIICIDVNKFKLINGIFGQSEGNKLLIFITQKLNEIFANNPQFIVSRYNADIFCICLPSNMTEEIANKLEHIADDYKISFDILIYIGIYNISDKSISVDIMCDEARLALSTIKGNYLIRHIYFNEKMNEILINEQEILNMMNTALIEGQFKVYMQPQYQLNTYKMCGSEALVRWIHPEKGLMFPNDFIPLFERNGFIMKMDEYVWEQVCIFIKQRLDENKKVLPVSVNISKVNIYNPKLCDIILSLIDKYKIPPNLFQVELTESAYSENKSALLNVVKKWREKGIVVMMDDFGSGYSSLNILKDISVDVLKIDLRFLEGNDDSGKGKSIMSSVIRMAKWLNMHVIAEGIETKEQADFLRSVGCEYGQGYFFAKPMPLDNFEQLLDTQKIELNARNVFKSSMNFNFIKKIWQEAQTNLLFNDMTCPMGIYEYNNGKIEAIYLNDAYYNMHGISRDEFKNAEIHILDWIYENDKEILINLFNDALASGKIVEGTFRKHLLSGKKIYLNARVEFITGNEQNGVYLAVLNDVTHEKAIEKKLERNNLEMSMLLQTTPAAIVKFRWNKNLSILYANDYFYAMLGHTKESYAELNNNGLEKIIPMSVYKQIHAEYTEVIKNRGSKLFTRIKALAKDGSYRYVMSGNGFIYDKKGVTVLSTNLDITELINTEEKLQTTTEQLKQKNMQLNDKYKLERQLREVVSASSLFFCEIDLTDNSIININYENLKLTDFIVEDKTADRLGELVINYIHPDDIDAFEGFMSVKNLYKNYKAGIFNIKQELRFKLKENSSYTWLELTTSVFKAKTNEHICCTITAKDISEAKQYELALIDKSEKDSLTDLYNNVKFRQAVNYCLAKNKNGVFYMLDLDNFKFMNDKFGHAVGDRLIVSVAHILSKFLPANTILSRLGGDEFAAFISGDISKAQAEEYAQTICREVREKAPDKLMSENLTCSLGVSICSENSFSNYNLLYTNADKALYFAKRAGKNNYVFCENNTFNNTKILVADDSNIRRTIILSILSDKYNIIETANGADCLEKANEFGNDLALIILDSTLPDKSCLQILEEIKSNSILNSIPIILLTLKSDTELKQKAQEFGVEFFIDKPIVSEAVIEYVDHAINEKIALK